MQRKVLKVHSIAANTHPAQPLLQWDLRGKVDPRL